MTQESDPDKIVRDAVAAIWRAGFKSGHGEGFVSGRAVGRSTLGYQWFFVVLLVWTISAASAGFLLGLHIATGPAAPPAQESRE